MAPPVSGYVAWYDAAQITGVADTAQFATWPDLSGQGLDLHVAGGFPNYRSSGSGLVNGLPAVWFNGSDGSMDTASVAPVQARTIFIVAQSSTISDGSSTGVVFFDGINGSERTWLADWVGVPEDPPPWTLFAGSDWAPGPPADINLHVFGCVFNGASSYFSIDGVVYGPGDTGAEPFTGLRVAGSIYAAGFVPTGPTCEVIVYPTALSLADVASVSDYLMGKWVWPPKISTLIDDFSSGVVDPTLWGDDPAGDISVVNGQLTIANSDASGYTTFWSVDAYDLTESQIRLEMISAGDWSLPMDCYIAVSGGGPPGFNLGDDVFFWWQGGDTPTISGNSVVDQYFSLPYDPVAMRWLGMRDTGGVIYFEFSPDGIDWTVAGSLDSPYVGAYAHDPLTFNIWNGGGATLVFDNVNFVPPPLPKFDTLVDDFDSGVLNPVVWWSPGPPAVTIVDGQLDILAASTIPYIMTQSFWDLTESSIYIQLVNPGDLSIPTLSLWPLSIWDSTGETWVEWNMLSGTLIADVFQVPVFSAPFDFAVHKWFRIRESAGTIYWDYSTDGLTWTNAASQADPFDMTQAQLFIVAGVDDQNDSSTTTVIYDNLNNPPPLPKFDTLVDDFNSGVLDPAVWAPEGDVEVVDGQVILSTTTDEGGSFSGLQPVNYYALTDSYFRLQVVSVGDLSLTTLVEFPILFNDYTGDDSQDSNAVYWLLGGGTTDIGAWIDNDPSGAALVTLPYDPVAMAWLGLRESGGTLYWEYSADGLAWVVAASASTPLRTDAGSIGIGIVTTDTEDTATSLIIDNINIVPVPVPVSISISMVATAGMTIEPLVIKGLVSHVIDALGGMDSSMLGATSYVDAMATSRLEPGQDPMVVGVSNMSDVATSRLEPGQDPMVVGVSNMDESFPQRLEGPTQ